MIELLLLVLLCTAPGILFLFLVLYITGNNRGRGKSGELVTATYLETLNNGESTTARELQPLDEKIYTVFNNITIKHGDYYTQIDHIVVSPFGIFVIETKVRKGSIYGNAQSKVWMQYIGKFSYELQNPIHQNYRHVMTIRQILSQITDELPISIIAFSGNTELNLSGKMDNCHVVRISEVTTVIKEYNRQLFNEVQVHNILIKLQELKSTGKAYEKEHIEYIKKKHHLR